MKKVLRCMCMMALVALAFTSCKKNEGTKQHFYASTQEFNVESVDENRAYVDTEKMFHFEKGDVCMVFNIDETTPTNSHAALYGALQEGVTDVEFVNIGYGEVAEDMLDGYYAFYPGGVGYTVTYLADGANKCKFYVAPEQEYRENTVAEKTLYAAAKAKDGTHLIGDTYFFFKAINGVFRLKPYEAAGRTVTKIEIVDNAWMLSGLVELIIPEIDADEMESLFNNFDLTNPTYVAALEAYKTRVGYNVTDETIDDGFNPPMHYVKGNRMTLNIPGGVQLATSKNDPNAPTFNIVLRPLALSQGFHMIFTFDNGDTKDVDFSNIHSLMIKPNTITPATVNLDSF